MGFITYVEVKCMTTIIKRAWVGKKEYTDLRFSHFKYEVI